MYTFLLVENLEMVVHQQLNIPSVQAGSVPTDLYKVTYENVITSSRIMESWEKISSRKYEEYSWKLLAKMTELWITVHGHSFAKDWNVTASYLCHFLC